ncbi:3-deoxy-8-phosphooctulonate synthase [Candidatus Shapirobacteria bacterium]|nr:MAG: 3-deoxy-8-phosphooctulonate synthase [Candidatus Shapirobacteria bacterium]
MIQKHIFVKDIKIGNDLPFTLIAGPDSIESVDHALFMARSISEITHSLNINYIFKASYDKANRTSVKSFRGVGIKQGKRILKIIRNTLNIPVTTDIHSPQEAQSMGKVVDLIQIPALLSRQTDILIAAGKTNKTVNIKKGQFVAPHDIQNLIDKVLFTGNKNVLITDRGSTFGYNDIIADMRGLVIMKKTGFPIMFDASHTVQFPSSLAHISGGDRSLIPPLARAATAVGVSGIFMEVHDKPDLAPVDGLNSLYLKDLRSLLKELIKIDSIVKNNEK